MLREAKAALEPLLNAAGFVFHGQGIRRPRSRAAVETETEDSLDSNDGLTEDHDDEREFDPGEEPDARAGERFDRDG